MNNFIAVDVGCEVRYVNLANVVEIRDYPALPERGGEGEDEPGVTLPAKPRSVEVVTTAVLSEWDSGGDFPEFAHTDYHPYALRFNGDAAEKFMRYLAAAGVS